MLKQQVNSSAKRKNGGGRDNKRNRPRQQQDDLSEASPGQSGRGGGVFNRGRGGYNNNSNRPQSTNDQRVDTRNNATYGQADNRPRYGDRFFNNRGYRGRPFNGSRGGRQQYQPPATQSTPPAPPPTANVSFQNENGQVVNIPCPPDVYQKIVDGHYNDGQSGKASCSSLPGGRRASQQE